MNSKLGVENHCWEVVKNGTKLTSGSQGGSFPM
jgi:hypothetical protein